MGVMGGNRGKRQAGRPPKAQTMDADMRFRLFAEQKELIKRAAQRRGKGSVSDWARETLLQAAQKELGESDHERGPEGGEVPGEATRNPAPTTPRRLPTLPSCETGHK